MKSFVSKHGLKLLKNTSPLEVAEVVKAVVLGRVLLIDGVLGAMPECIGGKENDVEDAAKDGADARDDCTQVGRYS